MQSHKCKDLGLLSSGNGWEGSVGSLRGGRKGRAGSGPGGPRGRQGEELGVYSEGAEQPGEHLQAGELYDLVAAQRSGAR